jgi:hypothetical protein
MNVTINRICASLFIAHDIEPRRYITGAQWYLILGAEHCIGRVLHQHGLEEWATEQPESMETFRIFCHGRRINFHRTGAHPPHRAAVPRRLNRPPTAGAASRRIGWRKAIGFRPISVFPFAATVEVVPKLRGLLCVNCHAKRLECVQLAGAFERSRAHHSGSKLRALQTLRAVRLWLFLAAPTASSRFLCPRRDWIDRR